MRTGKVIIIGGNKRAGKTTLSLKLHKNYHYKELLNSCKNMILH